MSNLETRVAKICRELGITELPDWPLCAEAEKLVLCEQDMYGRDQHMTPGTAAAWRAMRDAAAADGITLLLVSAFRSVDYQCGLIQRKLDAGQLIDDILKVNAPPGFSEHHTGRALDIATPDDEPLTESFETTDAFAWLTREASTFGFTMSYPRDNPHGIDYEPWHWAFQGDEDA